MIFYHDIITHKPTRNLVVLFTYLVSALQVI